MATKIGDAPAGFDLRGMPERGKRRRQHGPRDGIARSGQVTQGRQQGSNVHMLHKLDGMVHDVGGEGLRCPLGKGNKAPERAVGHLRFTISAGFAI